jgi:hypothetical protein
MMSLKHIAMNSKKREKTSIKPFFNPLSSGIFVSV